VIFGDDFRTRAMSGIEVIQLREIFIDYWTAERIGWTIYSMWRLVAVDRTGAATGRGLELEMDPLTMSNRYSHPMPGVWKASQDLEWDLRTVPVVERSCRSYVS